MNVENKLEYYENCYVFNYIVCFVYFLVKNGDCRSFGGKIFNEEKGYYLDFRGENFFDRRGVKV